MKFLAKIDRIGTFPKFHVTDTAEEMAEFILGRPPSEANPEVYRSVDYPEGASLEEIASSLEP